MAWRRAHWCRLVLVRAFVPASQRAAVAALLLAVFSACVAVPLVQAFAQGERCCGQGRCCHHPKPSTQDCLRSVCPCGGHESVPPASPTRDDALLRARARIQPGVAVLSVDAPPDAPAVCWRARPIDHPPPSLPA